jgi:membrane fusion protein, multidrug efflux system
MHFHSYKIFVPAFFAVSMIAAACGNKKEAGKAGGPPPGLKAEGYVVTSGSFSNDFTASGSLMPNEEVEIHPEISGRVTAIKFKEGSKVRKGQVLVQLYNADVQSQIQKLKAQKQLQQKTIDRQKELLNIGGISQQEYDATQTGIQAMDADIAYAEAQLRGTVILAPFDGTIGLRSVSEGAVVSPATTIASLQQTQTLKMDFSVPDHYRDAVKDGKEVLFTVTSSNDTLKGKIVATDPGASQNTRTIRVRAAVSNADGKLLAGSFAHVLVPFETKESSILIPSQAVIPTTRDKKVVVMRNGKAEFAVVKLGARTSDKVEVLSGLQVSDTIITTGLMQVKQGMAVTITKLKG